VDAWGAGGEGDLFAFNDTIEGPDESEFFNGPFRAGERERERERELYHKVRRERERERDIY